MFLDSSAVSHTSKQQTEKPTLTLIGPELCTQHNVLMLHQQNTDRLSDEETACSCVSSVLSTKSFYFQCFLFSLWAAVSCWPFLALHISLILKRIVSLDERCWHSDPALLVSKDNGKQMKPCQTLEKVLTCSAIETTHVQTERLCYWLAYEMRSIRRFPLWEGELCHAWVSCRGPKGTLVNLDFTWALSIYEGGL